MPLLGISFDTTHIFALVRDLNEQRRHVPKKYRQPFPPRTMVIVELPKLEYEKMSNDMVVIHVNLPDDDPARQHPFVFDPTLDAMIPTAPNTVAHADEGLGEAGDAGES